MPSPCTEDGCGIHLSVTDDILSAEAVIADVPCNGLSCIPGQGLFVYEDQSLVQAGLVPSDGGGFTVDLGALAVGVPTEVSSPPFSAVGPQLTNTFTNESACLSENVISVITAREVRFDGPAGAWFTVQWQADINGGGFVGDIFNIISDYRFTATGPGGLVSDARAGGAGAAGLLLPAAGSFTYRYRIMLTNNVAVPAGSIVTSPGLSFCHLSVTN